MKKVYCVVCVLMCICLMLPVLSGCGEGDVRPPAEDGRLVVVCTSYPAKEFVRALLDGADVPLTAEEKAATGNYGDVFETVELYSRSGDMHGFEPTAADMHRLAQADVLVCVGGESEVWVDAAVKACGNPTLKVIKMMELVEVVEEEVPEGAETEAEEEHGTEVEYDEHVWTSIRNDLVIVEAVAAALAEAYPAGADKIAENAGAYKAELSALDAAYTDMVAGAARHEVLIADRYPFIYLMRDYGLTCWAAFPGCSSETQASFATQVFLVEQVKAHKLPVVFTVDNAAGSVADTVSSETGAKIMRLWSGQTVPDGDMTYLQMLRENLDALRAALN